MFRKCSLLYFSVLLAFLITAFVGCTSPFGNGATAQDTDASARAATPTVYTAGLCTDDPAGGACYWQGKKRVDLSGDSTSGIYISSGTVYTAGSYFNGSEPTPCYWKRNTRVDLPGASSLGGGHAYSIFVNGGLVYVAGYRYSYGYHACVWIDNNGNINLIDLTLPATNTSYANSIYVVGTTIYVAGGYEATTPGGVKEIAYLWTSLGRVGSCRDLSTSYSRANSLVVSGGKAYIAGFNQPSSTMKACYWTWRGDSVGNTISLSRTDLQGNNAEARAIFLSGGRVYTSGFVNGDNVSGTGTACYWTNKTRTNLMSITSRASSIFVYGGKVYTAGGYLNGNSDYKACYWTNKARTDLPDFGTNTWSWGNGIWVN
jgi:hypothetical protein